MLVYNYFKGDTKNWVTDVQDEMYSYVSSSLNGILRNHYIHYNTARIYFRPEQIEGFKADENNDHRILQGSHDLLAAVFRYKCQQGEFNKSLFDDTNEQLRVYFNRLYIDIDFFNRIPKLYWYLTKAWHTFATTELNDNKDLIRELARAHFVYNRELDREECQLAVDNASREIIKAHLDIPWEGIFHEWQISLISNSY